MLLPFSTESAPEDCRIEVMLSIDENRLRIAFDLMAQLADLAIPEFEPSNVKRRDNLWEHTCFEVFLRPEISPSYWEFNLSPSGEWNVWSFSGYRKGMQPETCFSELPSEVQTLSESEFRVEISIDLKPLPAFSYFNLGLSAVLEQKDGEKSYWAVSHSGNVPDFHAEKGWLKIVC